MAGVYVGYMAGAYAVKKIYDYYTTPAETDQNKLDKKEIITNINNEIKTFSRDRLKNPRMKRILNDIKNKKYKLNQTQPVIYQKKESELEEVLKRKFKNVHD